MKNVIYIRDFCNQLNQIDIYHDKLDVIYIYINLIITYKLNVYIYNR